MSSHQEEKTSQQIFIPEDDQANNSNVQQNCAQIKEKEIGQGDKEEVVNKRQSLGLGIGFGLHNIKDCVDFAWGSEGRINIVITNKLSEDIDIYLTGGHNNEKRETLKSGKTRIFDKKPKDGPVMKTTNYECEFWAKNKHAKMFVYGKKAKRTNNHYEVREQGIYLIEESKEFYLTEWERDEIDG